MGVCVGKVLWRIRRFERLTRAALCPWDGWTEGGREGGKEGGRRGKEARLPADGRLINGKIVRDRGKLTG